VIARRAVEARRQAETESAREAGRCPVCAFLDNRHAPDCPGAALALATGPATDRLIRFLEGRP